MIILFQILIQTQFQGSYKNFRPVPRMNEETNVGKETTLIQVKWKHCGLKDNSGIGMQCSEQGCLALKDHPLPEETTASIPVHG